MTRISLPDKIVTNDDMAASLDTSDTWVAERTASCRLPGLFTTSS